LSSEESQDPQFQELGDAARRAGDLFTSHVDEITTDAERHAEQVREHAQREADAARRAALESGRRVFERINAIERPLGELVTTLRGEMERVTAELNNGSYVDLPGAALADEPATDAEPEPEPLPEPQPEPEPEPEPVPAATVERDSPQSDAAVEEEPALAPMEDAAEPAVTKQRRRGFLRGRRSRGPFLSSPGECAVCQRSYQAETEEELEASGWSVSGDVGLCPSCQSEGWQLPEGAQLPFRRGAS
jgi:hypothetical protein